MSEDDKVTRLHVVTASKPDISKNDLIMVALNKAVEDHKRDIAEGLTTATGVIIAWARQYSDGTFGESRVIVGLNALEAIGLLKITADDIGDYGLSGGPEHFPDGGPHDEPEPA